MASTSIQSIAVTSLTLLAAATGCATAARHAERAMRPEAENRTRPIRRDRAAPAPMAADADLKIRTDHPRLFVGKDWPAATDAVARDWQAILIKRADDVMSKAPVAYAAKKMTPRSREALKRLSLLAGVYRFTHDPKYAEAGRRELLSVCAFPDWQPDDFLATAEMMMAVSTAYDWLYDALPEADRHAIVAGLVRNGLRPALHEYEIQSGWTRAKHNWNCVCNGGTIVAALALADEEPQLCRQVLGQALASIRTGMGIYDEHGGTVEGPMYHSYATRYLTFAAAALATAAPRQGGLANDDAAPSAKDGPEYRRWTLAGDYRLAMTGPTGKSANFGDSSEIIGNSAWMLWLAGENHEPNNVAFQVADDRTEPSIFDLLWYVPPVGPAEAPQLSPRLRQQGPPFAFESAVVLRPPSNDPLAPFVALRTGSTADHHSHLDLGNFVLDLLGERFAADLGPDEYGLPNYFTTGRADYLRTSTRGHNTLTIGDASQPGDVGVAPEVKSEGGAQIVRIDLTAAYPGARSVVRTATLNDQTVTIADDIRLSRAATVFWHLHTPAKVTPTRGGAILESNGKCVEMTVLEPAGTRLIIEPDATRPPERPVEGMTHVRVRVPVDGHATIRVRFDPQVGAPK